MWETNKQTMIRPIKEICKSKKTVGFGNIKAVSIYGGSYLTMIVDNALLLAYFSQAFLVYTDGAGKSNSGTEPDVSQNGNRTE